MPPKRKKDMENQVTRRKSARRGGEAVNYAVVKKEPESPPKPKVVVKGKKLKSEKRLKKPTSLGVKATIRCQECPKKFRIKESFLKHLQEEHSKLPGSVACKHCPARCPDSKLLEMHVNKFHEREIFECPHCKKEFVRYAHVLRHMAQKGCDGNEIASFPCEICTASFTRKDNLMVHLRLQHIERKKHSCKQCQYSTDTYSRLVGHVQKIHSGKPLQYECDHCGKVTSSRGAISKHLEIHGEKKYACDVCGYSTFTIEVMRRHVLTHVSKKPYKCAQCDATFIQRAQLQRHAGKHGTHICGNCNDVFGTQEQLFEHAERHECSDKKEEIMKNTVPIEIIKRPFACEVCHKTFRLEADMRRHRQSHALERPRRCMYCVAPRAYVRGEQLVKHVRRAHPRVFKEHLMHIRQVLGVATTMERVSGSELSSVLTVLDAEAERILQGYGEGVLYGGMLEADAGAAASVVFEVPDADAEGESSPLMSEEELTASLARLLEQLIDRDLLECFGWPQEGVDTVLEKVISHCGARAAERERWARVQRLRENTKRLFLYVIEDANIARMLDSHTIDQIVKHILAQVADPDGCEDKKVAL